QMSRALTSIQSAQVEQDKRLLASETRAEAQLRAIDRFWSTTWPELTRRLDRLESFTTIPLQKKGALP
ncbi:MAG: hypothetical protein VW405_00630, partial [Rhodospirillaceae bacterium]